VCRREDRLDRRIILAHEMYVTHDIVRRHSSKVTGHSLGSRGLILLGVFASTVFVQNCFGIHPASCPADAVVPIPEGEAAVP
jgi:hypothetical protein